MLEELLYFANYKFPEKTTEDIVANKLSFALLFKRSSDGLTGCIDDVVLQLVYGNSRRPPGDDNSPSQKLSKPGAEQNLPEEEAQDNVVLGIWAPGNCLARAMILKVLFPTISSPFLLPDVKEVPVHVAMAFDAFKAKDVMELSDKYPEHVLSYGYFSSDVVGEAKLIAKTTDKFESRTASATYEEKFVIQLAKIDPEVFAAFEDLGYTYMSKDVEIGESDCNYFFPDDYNTPEAEIITYLKKKSKKKGRLGKFPINSDTVKNDVPAENVNSTVDAGRGEDTLINGEEINDEERDSDDEHEIEDEKKAKSIEKEELDSIDKATSPINQV